MKIERRRTIRRCTEEVYLRVGERGKLEKLLRVEEMLRFFSFLFFLSLNFDSRRSIRVDVDFPREREKCETRRRDRISNDISNFRQVNFTEVLKLLHRIAETLDSREAAREGSESGPVPLINNRRT